MNRLLSLSAERVRFAWLLLVPTLLVVALVAAYPLLQTIAYSFTDARLASARPVHVVGLANYVELFTDRRFLSSLWVTLQFTLITVGCELALGLAVALTLNSQFRGRGVLRAAMLVPWAIPTVVSAQMWKWMYNDIYGVVNDLALRLGLIAQPMAWIADSRTLLAAVCAVDIWKTTPFVALLLLAGLQVIPPDVYEAARVDGASRLQQFMRITLPLLRPAIAVTLVFRTLDALRVFDLFYVMVGNRRGFQTAAIYNQQVLVEFSRIGDGAAVSMAIFALIAVFVYVYVTFLKVGEVENA